jgi:hypothetical protein
MWTGLAQSVQPHARAGRSGDRVLVEARFSAPFQTGSGVHPVGAGSLEAQGKRPRRNVSHTHPQSSAEVKERVKLNLYSFSGPLCLDTSLQDLHFGVEME